MKNIPTTILLVGLCGCASDIFKREQTKSESINAVEAMSANRAQELGYFVRSVPPPVEIRMTNGQISSIKIMPSYYQQVDLSLDDMSHANSSDWLQVYDMRQWAMWQKLLFGAAGVLACYLVYRVLANHFIAIKAGKNLADKHIASTIEWIDGLSTSSKNQGDTLFLEKAKAKLEKLRVINK